MFHTLYLSLAGVLLVVATLPCWPSTTKETSLIKDVYQMLQSELPKMAELNRDSFLGTRAFDDIRSLSAQEKVEVARTLAHDSDKQYILLGLYLLCETGHEDEVMPELSRLYVTLMWHDFMIIIDYWRSSRDKTLFARMSIKLGRYMLVHLDSYRPEERNLAEGHLLSLCKERGKNFTPSVAGECLAEAEERVRAYKNKTSSMGNAVRKHK